MIELTHPPTNHEQRMAGILALRKAYGLPLGEADKLLKRAPVTLPELSKLSSETELRRELEAAGLRLAPPPPRPSALTHIKVPFSEEHPNYDGPFCGGMDCLTLCGESTFDVHYLRQSLKAEGCILQMVNCPACVKRWKELTS